MLPIDSDAGYWRKMYEERIAVEEEGFGALLAERDQLRDTIRRALALTSSIERDLYGTERYLISNFQAREMLENAIKEAPDVAPR